MAENGDPPSRTTLYGGVGGGLGKMKRERKPPSTPYARPPSHRRRDGWLSRVVDPAKRLLSGGASRLLPSLFSPSPLPEVEQSEEEQPVVEQSEGEQPLEEQPESEHATEVLNENTSVNFLAPGSSGGVGSSFAIGNLKPDISCKVEEDKRREHSEGGVPDIEQLIKGKTFSRGEIDHLMEVLRSRVVNVEKEGKATSLTELQGVEKAQTSKGKQKISVIENDEIDGFQLALTPLQRPSLHDDIGASPVDIARAYMGSRTSEMGLTSASLSLKNEKWGLTSEFPSKSIMPSSLPKAPICWPGAVTQNQQGYSTPQNSRSRYGIHNLSRTPYSRTMYSKSKSKLTPLRGDSERLSHIMSTPFQPRETPVYGKSISTTTPVSYGSGGPIRRTRNKFTSTTPARNSPLVHSAHRSPFAKESNTDNMIKNNVERGSLSTTTVDTSCSKLQGSEIGMRSVHPHSSKLARQILEHIDRPVTLKEQSKELKLAASKNLPDVSSALPGVRKSIDLIGPKLHSQSNGVVNGWTQGKIHNDNIHNGDDMASVSKVNLDKTSVLSDDNGDSSSGFLKFDSRKRSVEQATANNLLKTNIFPSDEGKVDPTPNSTSFEPHNAQRKPFLPSLAVGKTGLRNSFSSDTSVGFTFPVTTSSNTYFDLPTPTVVPSSSSSSPQKPDVSPTRSKITIAQPVFPFPPSSTTSLLTEDVGPKFKFGSGEARLSFAIEGEDGTSTSSDAPSISYKFGAGKSRLSFGSISSYAVCL